MAIARFRQRFTRMEHVAPDWSNWNQPIFLGHFRHKQTVIQNGVPIETWGSPVSPQSYIPDLSTRIYEKTWDENHGYPRGRTVLNRQQTTVPRVFYDVGGPFLNVKVDTGYPAQGTVAVGTIYNAAGNTKYEGTFMMPPNAYWGEGWAQSPGSYASNSNALLPDVAPYFDQAWRKAKPKLETASLYVFLRELRDVPLMLQTTAKLHALEYQKITTRRTVNTEYGPQSVTFGSRLSSRDMKPQEAAEQFLNHQFGWSPFLSDLGKFYQTWVDADDTIRRLTMENGRWKKRSVNVTKIVDSQVIMEHTATPNATSYATPLFPVSLPADFFLSPPSWKLTEETQFTIHASGKFRFYNPAFDISLPDYTSAWNQVMRYMKIYGLSVNPYHIWQATPWTWLLDWVSNLGAFVERVSDTLEDSVAAAYFYITSRKTIKRRLEITLPLVAGVRSFAFERSFSTKQRVSADSPYGFSLSWDNLSPKRLAILGALGITRRASNFRFGD